MSSRIVLWATLVTICIAVALPLFPSPGVSALDGTTPTPEPTLSPAPTRWPYPLVVTGTRLALTERASMLATYYATTPGTPTVEITEISPAGGSDTPTPTEAGASVPTSTPTETPAQIRQPAPTPTATPTWPDPCTRGATNCYAYLPFTFLRRHRR